MFKVMNERCDQCLYGKKKIVSNDRRAEILREVTARDSYFICHKATIAGQNVCCRGDWDKRGGGQIGRIAGRLNVVRFIDEAELQTQKNAPGPTAGQRARPVR